MADVPKHVALHPAMSEGAGSLRHGSHTFDAAILFLALHSGREGC